ncbi:hypothetical protein [Streptomyces hokutonensis]|uniref:Uncharacterized protein n=1 Tax=Streptomyces hokutonensis TaxID=1306990 RepID=A0ABW6M9K2_9ACTN
MGIALPRDVHQQAPGRPTAAGGQDHHHPARLVDDRPAGQHATELIELGTQRHDILARRALLH